MSSRVPTDYTLERARKVYSQDEFTRWLIMWGLSDPQLAPFTVDIIAVRGEYMIFAFGYADQKIYKLGWAPTIPGIFWWKPMLATVQSFYVESKFYPC